MNIRIKNGPVAYFDILGYKSINDNNEIKKVAQIIIDHLDGIPVIIHDFLKKAISPISPSSKDENKFARSISCLLLSDSILLTSKQPFKVELKLVNWLFFLLTCSMLMNNLFNKGLILRGAVGYGEYFKKRNCFAGKPIIDACELSECLDLAGCAIVPNAWEEIEDALADEGMEQMADLIRSITFRYEVPLKNDKSEPRTIIPFDIPKCSDDDIVKILHTAFTTYNRGNKITKDVERKIQNTAMMIESFLQCK